MFTRIIGKIFGMLAAKPLTNVLEKAIKTANENEEVKAALGKYLESRARTLDKMATYCEKNPDSPLCYGKFAKTYGFDFNPNRKKGDRSRWMVDGKQYRR